jgi:hypothetical protein
MDLDALRIASPCPVPWSTLRGDDRVRDCELCSKNVYNLSGLAAAEATELIQTTEEGVCLRLYRRRDGTVLTADCPAGRRSVVRRRLLRLATAGVVVLATLWTGILYKRGVHRPELLPAPTGPGVTLSDWVDWAAQVLGIRELGTGGRATMGY